MRKKPVDLIFFDFDGTLTDSLSPIISTVQITLNNLNYPFKSKKEIATFIGKGERHLITKSIGSDNPAKVDEAVELFHRLYLNILQNLPLYPQVKETLEFFSDKIKIIVSNQREEFIRLIMEHQQIINYFSKIYGAENPECRKPDPCAIEETLKTYNISRDKAIFIGDMTIDIQTGKNGHILTCGASYGFEGKNYLKKAKPDFLINHITDLKNIIS
jgi:phosphoglycolate phosphatase